MEHCVCFCSLSFTDSVLLPQPALPPHLSWIKQVMLMLSCWQGQQGYNLSPPIPDEPADEWHITVNASTVVLSGKWDKDKTLCAGCAMSPSLWTPVPLAMWVDSKEEMRSFCSSRPPSCVLAWVSFYGRKMKSAMYILVDSVRERRWCFVVIIISLVQEVKSRNFDTHPLYREPSWLLNRKMQQYLFLRRSPESQQIIY